MLTFLDSRKRGSALGCVGMYRGISDSNRYDQVGNAHWRARIALLARIANWECDRLGIARML